MTKYLNILQLEKSNFFIKIKIYSFIGRHGGAFSSQKRTSSTSNMIFIFYLLFLFLRVIFALLDPDPAIKIYADPEPDQQH
jgi:hypothetical protein